MSLIPLPASANSDLSSTALYLKIDDESSSTPQFEGLQIVSCADEACQTPQLLFQADQCNKQGCLGGDPLEDRLKCTPRACDVVSRGYEFEFVPEPYARIIIQFEDKVRISDPFSFTWHDHNSNEIAIVVKDDTLTASGTQSFLPRYNNFWAYFQFTLFVEAIAGFGLAMIWLKRRGKQLIRIVWYILIANLLSYPTTWYILPALGRLQPRKFGVEHVCFIAFIFVWGIMLSFHDRKKLITLLWGGILGILMIYQTFALLLFQGGQVDYDFLFTFNCIILLCSAAFICLFWISRTRLSLLAFVIPTLFLLLIWIVAAYYGNQYNDAEGFSRPVTVFILELFAIGFETALLYGLFNRKLQLSWLSAFVICSVANIASWLLGALFLDSWLDRIV